MRRMLKPSRSPRVASCRRIHAISGRLNATRTRMFPIPHRMLLSLRAVHASRRGMSLAPRTVNATGDRVHGGACRIVLGWRTDDAMAGRIRAGSVRREP